MSLGASRIWSLMGQVATIPPRASPSGIVGLPGGAGMSLSRSRAKIRLSRAAKIMAVTSGAHLANEGDEHVGSFGEYVERMFGIRFTEPCSLGA